jgi:hypothetical protein
VSKVQLEIERDLLKLSKAADSTHQGHVTIMRFGSGWKIFFGTPTLSQEERKFVWELENSKSLLDAVSLATEDPKCICNTWRA